jgi:hypothetical protein
VASAEEVLRLYQATYSGLNIKHFHEKLQSEHQTGALQGAHAGAPLIRTSPLARTRMGLVWVDTSTKVYYKGRKFYGKTRRGEFMPEDVAKKDGNREEKPTDGKK